MWMTKDEAVGNKGRASWDTRRLGTKDEAVGTLMTSVDDKDEAVGNKGRGSWDSHDDKDQAVGNKGRGSWDSQRRPLSFYLLLGHDCEFQEKTSDTNTNSKRKLSPL